MPKTPFLTTPIKTDKMPPGIPYIIGNEAAERFNFYGMRAILFVFMTQYLVNGSGVKDLMDPNDANRWYHIFLFANYFFPTMGAIVSDVFWGKYRTILWLSLVYCAGSVVLAFDHTRVGLTLGLTLIALGSGGIKPCVSANVGDQFGTTNQHLLARAFGWFYFSINLGSSVSIYLIPILLAKYGPGPAFGLPAVLMLIATYVFWAGRHKTIHVPPAGRKFLNELCTRESLMTIVRLAVVFSFMIAFWSLWDQSGSEWVEQAEKMDLHFLGLNWLASQVQVVNAFMVLAFIPLCQYVIYPMIDRVWTVTPLRKIGLGLVMIGLSFLVSAWIEGQLVAGVKLNVGWQMPAYALLTLGEVMASITALEFAYTQAPRSLKSVIQSLYLLSISFGNLFTGLVHWFIKNPDGTLKLSGPSYYVFYAGVAGAAALVFTVFALRYKGKTYLQEAPAAAPLTDAPQGT